MKNPFNMIHNYHLLTTMLLVILLASSSCGWEYPFDTSPDDDSEYFDARTERDDPDFSRDYEIIGTEDTKQSYNKSELRDAEIIVSIDQKSVYLIVYSYQTGYTMTYFVTESELSKFIRAMDGCIKWARKYDRYKKSQQFYRYEFTSKPNSLKLIGVMKSTYTKGGICEITMTDHRDSFVSDVSVIHLTGEEAWNVRLALNEAKAKF
ncbi:MAG: hypothetical protein OXC40_07975 [Proteobacteria bacterium]|nr:hypothetical protein [Pseudomonadota bacterium]